MPVNHDGPLWVFGYGSLIWRPDFPHVERHPGFIEGWARRFWQGSTDHRGLPHAPGRVATLIREASASCWGMAFRVLDADRDAVLADLDHRESGGFERHEVEVHLSGPVRMCQRALVYIASHGNPNYLGPAALEDMVDQMRCAVGPSGPNVEYVLRLDAALREIGGEDPHLSEIVDRLRRPRTERSA
ncbi:MAG: gamma-glutamylcyclotransferase [Myxococcales bacterium]|nr:gamma-glutamylcyclotransferase [Myxococcales bacterium]